jgi:hypothetical protein
MMASTSKKNKVNSFRPQKFQDHVIVNSTGHVVGHIRVKPSGVLWAPSNGKVWYGVPLAKFVEFIESNGRTQKK